MGDFRGRSREIHHKCMTWVSNILIAYRKIAMHQFPGDSLTGTPLPCCQVLKPPTRDPWFPKCYSHSVQTRLSDVECRFSFKFNAFMFDLPMKGTKLANVYSPIFCLWFRYNLIHPQMSFVSSVQQGFLFPSSGGEANDCAIRLARLYTGASVGQRR